MNKALPHIKTPERACKCACMLTFYECTQLKPHCKHNFEISCLTAGNQHLKIKKVLLSCDNNCFYHIKLQDKRRQTVYY